MRVAAVQAEATPGAVEANLAKAIGLVRSGADRGADLIVFPEAFVTGYSDAALSAPAPPADDPSWLEELQGAVDERGVVVILNSPLDRGDRRTMTDIVLAPGRSALAAYDKQHLYEAERRWLTPGEHGCTLSVRGTTVALSICYDANFPEHAAAAAHRGAAVYINSGAYFPGGAERRDLHYASRALDNGMYVVFSGLLGAPSGFIGGSAVFDPLGKRIAHVEDVEGLAIADVEPAVVSSARRAQTMWADRRDDLDRYIHCNIEEGAGYPDR